MTVVALAILMQPYSAPTLGIPVTGNIPEGLPASRYPRSGCWNSKSYFRRGGCLLLA